MRSLLIFLVIASLLFFGCTSEIPVVGPTTEQGDIEVVSFNLLNDSSIFLGDSFKVSSVIKSSSENATYVVNIKLKDKIVFTDEFKGNKTITPEIYAPINGKLNLTINVYSKDISKFVDLNLENNEKTIPLHIHSYGTYNFSSSTTKHTVISNERVFSNKLTFENPVQINSIGSFLRVTTPLNVDSNLIYEIVKDDEGKPSNETVFDLKVQLYRIKANWDFLLLQKDSIKLEPGTYWLNFYVDEKNFLEVGCRNVSNSTNSLIGNKINEEIYWKEHDCEAYFIISDSSLVETYEDFSNRFSIFDT
jgi:hypothetical protein